MPGQSFDDDYGLNDVVTHADREGDDPSEGNEDGQPEDLGTVEGGTKPVDAQAKAEPQAEPKAEKSKIDIGGYVGEVEYDPNDPKDVARVWQLQQTELRRVRKEDGDKARELGELRKLVQKPADQPQPGKGKPDFDVVKAQKQMVELLDSGKPMDAMKIGFGAMIPEFARVMREIVAEKDKEIEELKNRFSDLDSGYSQIRDVVGEEIQIKQVSNFIKQLEGFEDASKDDAKLIFVEADKEARRLVEKLGLPLDDPRTAAIAIENAANKLRFEGKLGKKTPVEPAAETKDVPQRDPVSGKFLTRHTIRPPVTAAQIGPPVGASNGKSFRGDPNDISSY